MLDAVQTRLPDVDFVYLADSANAPYGVRTAEDIIQSHGSSRSAFV